MSTENQYCTLHSLSSDEGCVDPRNHLEDLLDNPHLQTISLDGSSLVEKKSIPVDLENPAEALFLTDKEKRFMQCYDAHLQGKLSIHYFFLRTAMGQCSFQGTKLRLIQSPIRLSLLWWQPRFKSSLPRWQPELFGCSTQGCH